MHHGNGIRMQHATSKSFYDLNIIERVTKNLPDLINNIFGNYAYLFAILFFIMLVYIAYKTIKNKYGIKILNQITIISNILILFISIWKNDYYSFMLNITENKIVLIAIYSIIAVQAALILYNVLVYFYKEKSERLAVLFISAILSQLVMLNTPNIPLRSQTMFQIIIFIFMIYVFVDIIKDLKNEKNIYYLLVPFIIISMFNIAKITYGFAKNSEEEIYNYNELKSISKRIEDGEDIQEIELKKLKDMVYTSDQPYFDGCDYITYYIKKYFNLPESIDIVYK